MRQKFSVKTSGNCGNNFMFDSAHIFLASTGGIMINFPSSNSYIIVSYFQTLNLILLVEITGKKVHGLPAGRA